MLYCSSSLGEVSEWFKEPVLKTGDSERGRGFESHPLRHQLLFERKAGSETWHLRKRMIWRSTQEAKEDGLLNR